MAEAEIGDPRFLIWTQLDRVNAAYSDGMQAGDALSILEGMLSHFKDSQWRKDYRDMVKDGGGETFIQRYRACIGLMARKGVWVEESIIEAIIAPDEE